jgi:hypothetical protein
VFGESEVLSSAPGADYRFVSRLTSVEIKSRSPITMPVLGIAEQSSTTAGSSYYSRRETNSGVSGRGPRWAAFCDEHLALDYKRLPDHQRRDRNPIALIGLVKNANRAGCRN